MLRSLLPCILAVICSRALAAERNDPPDLSSLPKIGIVGIHQASLDMADQQRTIDALVAAIEATGRFDALPLGEVATTIGGREAIIVEESLLAAGRRDLATGKSSFNQAATEDAIASLEIAIEKFLGALPATNETSDLWDAYVTMGNAYLQSDPPDEVAARQAFIGAVALSPAKPLNPALYPPNVIALFGLVQNQAQASKVGVDITTNAPASVWLDGLPKGQAPLAIEGIAPGTHHVVARGEGTQGYVQFEVRTDAATPAGDRRSVAVELGPVRLGEPAVSAAARSDQIAALYQSLGNRADGLDYLLVAGVSDSLLVLQLLSTKSDTFSKGMELPYTSDADDEAAQAVGLLLGGIDAQGAFVAVSPVPAPVDISANTALALLLTGQIPAIPVGGKREEIVAPPPKKSKLPLVLGIATGVIVAGAGTGGLVWLQQSQGTEPNQGSIVVQF